jgi:anaerobic selenocysteine-containing dehydrogenase
LHPEAAAQRGISPGDWVYIETPRGRVRARAKLNDALAAADLPTSGTLAERQGRLAEYQAAQASASNPPAGDDDNGGSDQ